MTQPATTPVHLPHLLRRASQIADEQFSQHGLDITPRQYAVLATISAAPLPPSQTYLVNESGVDRSTLADIVRRLVKTGHIQRRRNKIDARAYELSLTKAGHSAVAAGAAAASLAERAIDARLHPAERMVLRRALTALVAAACDPPASAKAAA